MKKNLFILLCLCLLLAAPAAAANITNCTVENTNIYASSNVFDIGPANSYTDSTASGITNVAGRYLYASGISAAVDEDTATFSLITRQGSTTINTTLGTAQGYLWEYGDGTTGTADTHTYEIGIYTANLTISNELTESPITLSTRLQIGDTTINVSLSAAEIGTGGSWTLNAQTQNAETVQWQVKTPGSTTWQNISGTTYTPTTYGSYQFRAIANGLNTQIISDTLSGTYEASIQGCTVENTNIYASSNVFDIGPANSYTDSTASGITNVAGRYLYASALTAAVDGPSAVYTISGLQGSTTILADIGTAQGYSWEYGDGKTGNTDSLEHLYRESGTYQTNLTLTNYLDSTGVTLQANTLVFGPYIGNFEVDKTAGGVGDSFNLSVIALNASSVEWQLSRQAVGGWSTIYETDGSSTYTLIPDATGHWYLRVKATNSNTGFTDYTNTITITVYAKPATGNIKVSPNFGPLETQVQLSAGVEDPGSSLQATTYQWQISPAGGNWTNIAGATQKSSSVTLDLDASGTYYFRIAATGIGGTAYSAPAEYRAYSAPVFETVSVSPTKGGAPLQVKLSATASDATAYRWEYSTGGGVWMQVAKSAAAYYTLNAEGTFYFRAVATGFGGTTYSDAVTVDVGDLPDVSITSPQYSGMWFETGSTVSFSAEDESGVTYSWNFGDGSTGSGRSVSHVYSAPGKYEVVLSASNYFGTKQDRVVVIVSDPTGDVQLMVDRVSTTGAELTGTITVSPVDAGTLMWFEIESLNGQTIWRSAKQAYNTGAISIDASGMPMMSGQAYQAIAYTNNYGYSLPQLFVLLDAVQAPYEPLGDAWNDGLSREPFNVSALVAAGIGVYSGALGGGAVGAAVAFGVIVMFVLVGLWLRQQDIVIPLTLTLVAGWFVIGNLPGEWQPIAYTLMVVAVVAIFFYLFRKRIE